MKDKTEMSKMKDRIIPPIPTPFVDEEFSPEKLKFNLEKMNSTQVGGFLVLGSNGEAVFLSDEDKFMIIETSREFTPPDWFLVVGAGHESTKGTIQFTRRAAELGADYALIGNPHYYKAAMTPEILYDHYKAIAEASPIPIIPYNSPGFTGINMGPQLIGKLAEHPNVLGVKDGTGNVAQLSEFKRLGGSEFLIFTGNAPTFLAALFVGISGGMMPIANIYPDLWVQMLRLYRKGDLEEARRLESILMPMTTVIMKYGIGGIKAAMDILGFYGGPPLRPLNPPSSHGLEEIRMALKKVEEAL